MKIVYEAQSNVHVPSLKCTYPVGTRFSEEDGIVSVNLQEFQVNNEFNVLVRHGFIKKLTEEEVGIPEAVKQQKVAKIDPRPKMTVTIQEDLSSPLAKEENEDARIVQESNESDEGKTIRGMKVISENAAPIKKELENADALKSGVSEENTPPIKKEISPEKEAQVEAIKKARLEALEKARSAAKEKAAKAKEAKENASAGQEKE